jgi:AcrR family transcriptional regulator
MTGSERREQLREVTTRIVAEQGFPAVSIESVARGAGISRPIVYAHFGDLPGLLEAVVERETSRALSQVSETALTDLTEGDPQELMLESLGAYLHAVRDHPTTWRLVLIPPEGAPELLRKSIAQGRAAVLERLAQAVRPALIRDPESPDAELTAVGDLGRVRPVGPDRSGQVRARTAARPRPLAPGSSVDLATERASPIA